MTTAVVTGSGGFCGRALLDFLARRGVCVVALHHADFSSPHSPDAGPSPEGLVRALRGRRIDYVFHLAGTSHTPDARVLGNANVLSTIALFEALRVIGAKPVVVLVGSAAEYGRVAPSDLPLRETAPEQPVDAYGSSKLAQTHLGRLAAAAGYRVVMTRPFNIVGPGMPARLALGNFLRQLTEALPAGRCRIQVGNLAASRDFITVEDAVRAWWELAQLPAACGLAINICSGVPMQLQRVVELLAAAAPIPVEIRPAQTLARPTDIPEHYGCNDRLRDLLGWVPSPLNAATMARLVQRHLESTCVHSS